MKTFRKYFVEFLGMALSVIMIYSIGMSLSVCACTRNSTEFISQCVVFAFALISFSVYVLVYYGLSDNREAHLNPIITVAKMISLETKVKEGILYIVSQLTGAIVGSGFVGILFKTSDKFDQSKRAYVYSELELEYSRGYMLPTMEGIRFAVNPTVCAAIMEIFISFIMVLVILAVTNNKNKKKYAGIVCGMAVALAYFELMLSIRSFANPAMIVASVIMNLINGTMYQPENIWIFIVMPFIGAILASVVYKLFICSVKKKNVVKAFITECVAMFIFMVLTANFIMQFHYYSSIALVITNFDSITSAIAVSIICAIVYICLYHIFENITDVHLNPIVSIALWIDKKISFLKALTNIIAQLIGALLGLLLICKFRLDYAGLYDGTTDWTCECMHSSHSSALADTLAKYQSSWQMALLLEIFLGAIFIVFVLYAYKYMEQTRSIFIGAALAMIYLMDTFFNIMSVNPAKSVASAILNCQAKMVSSADNLKHLWIFIVGPIIGAVLVAVVHRIIEKIRNGGVKNEE